MILEIILSGILGILIGLILAFFMVKKKCDNCIFLEIYENEMEGVFEAIN